jgi:hypothetical protein
VYFVGDGKESVKIHDLESGHKRGEEERTRKKEKET